jgi:hypothetical protein
MKEADKPPFAAHRAYYIAIKLAVLAAALYIAVRYLWT